uniref:Bestrophin homolog n=1 Tax=Steinernema glaseri TaxID=37863 RepID=A0A1I8ASC8_9BILA
MPTVVMCLVKRTAYLELDAHSSPTSKHVVNFIERRYFTYPRSATWTGIFHVLFYSLACDKKATYLPLMRQSLSAVGNMA